MNLYSAYVGSIYQGKVYVLYAVDKVHAKQLIGNEYSFIGLDVDDYEKCEIKLIAENKVGIIAVTTDIGYMDFLKIIK